MCERTARASGRTSSSRRCVTISSRVVGFAKVTRDLTERRAAETQAVRLAAEQAAREAAEARSAELDALNHQLQEQAIELELQTQQAQDLAEELELSAERLEETLMRGGVARGRPRRAPTGSRAASSRASPIRSSCRTPIGASGTSTRKRRRSSASPGTHRRVDRSRRVGSLSAAQGQQDRDADASGGARARADRVRGPDGGRQALVVALLLSPAGRRARHAVA